MDDRQELTPELLQSLSDQLGDALDKFRGWKVVVPEGGRLDSARSLLSAVAAAGEFPSAESDLRCLAYAVRDAEEFARIGDALQQDPRGSLREDLERSLRGELGGTTTGTRVAVQYQTQLWAAAVLVHGGKPVRAPRTTSDPSPDYELEDGTLLYGVEVKRPLSTSQARKLVSKAARQLGNKKYHGGFLVVEATDCMPHEGVLITTGHPTEPDFGLAELMDYSDALENEVFDVSRLKIEPRRRSIFTLVTTSRFFSFDRARPAHALAVRRARFATFWRGPRGTLRYHRAQMLVDRFDRGMVEMGHVAGDKRVVAAAGTGHGA